MSSGPVGLDVREYTYGSYALDLTLGTGFYTISAHKNWLVTKVQFFTGANPGNLALEGGTNITVAANACLILEPNGAHRRSIDVFGAGSKIIVEFWFQAVGDQFLTSIPIELKVPPP